METTTTMSPPVIAGADGNYKVGSESGGMDLKQLMVRAELEDREYAEALREAIAIRYREICVVGEGEEADIVLGERDMPESGNEHFVLISEDSGKVRKLKSKKLHAVEKYESISDIAQAIILAASEIPGLSFGGFPEGGSLRKIEILGFFSASGGCGTTSIALGSAQYLRRFEGKRPLFLSMECFPSVSGFMNDSEEESIRDIENYVYRWRKGEKAAESPEIFMLSDIFGVWTFRSGRGINPLTTMTGKEIVAFLHNPVINKKFDSIVIDFGTTVSDAALELMKCCNRLYFVSMSERNEKREESCFSYIRAKETELKGVRRIINRCTASSEEKEGDENRGGTGVEERRLDLDDGRHCKEIRIFEDPVSFRKLTEDERVTPIDIDGVFGMGIKSFLSERQKSGVSR